MAKDAAAPLLEHWHEFYLLIATAAAALVALLFVAASIGAGMLTRHPGGPTRTYMSPIAFHFTSALFASAVALIPTHSRLSLGVLIGLNPTAGAIYAAFVLWRLFTDDIADVADRFCYGILPLLAYLAGLAAALLIFRRSTPPPGVLTRPAPPSPAGPAAGGSRGAGARLRTPTPRRGAPGPRRRDLAPQDQREPQRH